MTCLEEAHARLTIWLWIVCGLSPVFAYEPWFSRKSMPRHAPAFYLLSGAQIVLDPHAY